jgi:hypothetical protein
MEGVGAYRPGVRFNDRDSDVGVVGDGGCGHRVDPVLRMLLVRYAMSIPVTRSVWLELGPRDEQFLRDAGCPNDLIMDGRVDLRQLAARGWLVTESGLMSPAAIEQQARDDPDDVRGRWARESAAYWDRMNGIAPHES